MAGWLMKAFNVSFYDDRRLCFMEGCTPSMIAFKWDHAVRRPPATMRSSVLCPRRHYEIHRGVNTFAHRRMHELEPSIV